MTQIPATMRFIDLARPGGPEELRLGQTATPRPKTRMKLRFASRRPGVNRPDVAQRKAPTRRRPGRAPFSGLEAAGEIVAASGAT